MTSCTFHNHIAYINPNARMQVRFGTDLAQDFSLLIFNCVFAIVRIYEKVITHSVFINYRFLF